jgi:hypothetical protein
MGRCYEVARVHGLPAYEKASIHSANRIQVEFSQACERDLDSRGHARLHTFS